MTATWNDVANGARWRGVVSFIHNWVGPFDSVQGMASEELDAILCAKPLNLPAAVREWYQIAANWNQGGLNVWIRPQEITAHGGIVWILTDTEGISQWGVRVADLDTEDPPVVSLYENYDYDIAFPSFSKFVAAMIMNDVLFGTETDETVELNRDSARADLTCLVSSSVGDFFADAPLESATVVMFAYGNGPANGKAITPAGRALLQRLRRQTS